MELSRQQLTAAGEFSAEQGEVFKRYLRRDFEQTKEEVRQLGEEAKEHSIPHGWVLVRSPRWPSCCTLPAGPMTALSAKAEDVLVYQTGEAAMAGTLTCSACGHKVQMKATSAVPACSACRGTRFRKGYWRTEAMTRNGVAADIAATTDHHCHRAKRAFLCPLQTEYLG